MIQGADIPLYVQLKNWMRAQVESGQLKPYDMLPGERQLAESHRLSRTTVRQALNELVAEGVLFRRHGKGTYVAPPKYEHTLGRLTGFAEELQQSGLKPAVRLLTAVVQPAPAEVASILQVAVGEPVAFVERVVSVGDAPLFIHRAYILIQLGAMVLKADLVNESIYTIIERLGYPIRSGIQTISATALLPGDARLLDVAPGTPGLRVARVTYVAADSPVEYAEGLYRGDRYRYNMRLERNHAK